MDNKRKDIILKEIKYWKQSRLLPEHYCDFLLTLYSEGETLDQRLKEDSQVSKLKPFLWFITAQALFLLAVLVIYFTDFSLIMQITICLFISMTLLIIAKKSINELLSNLYLMMIAFIFLLLTVESVLRFTDGNFHYIQVVILFHCLVWFIIGWKGSIRFFTISAVLGLIVLLFFLFR
ncbi:hypothetical protein [Halalkalibacter alkalisediminis]|uniref:DUF2157 domain-containing protein n=1 Tax=Halalkalibacter alkalisediminis TaxID=935616 RepID=A0ABV6NBH8_9BACI|nr:hypothetical protein [Halalkalibacter alkalisediminis]